MNTDLFWQIIENTQSPTQEEQFDLFKRELQQLSVPELLEFVRYFYHYKFTVYNWDLWTVAWLMRGGWCSDDSFADFRSWLISRGREVYEKAYSEPDALVDDLKQVEDFRFESFGYVPGTSYCERTGVDELPDLGLPRPKQPSGGDWIRPELKDRSHSHMLNLCIVFNEMGDEEMAAIQQRFPRVWNHCIENGIIKLKDPNAPAEEPSSRLPTPEELAAQIDPNLAKTDLAAYLKALGDAARKAYGRGRSGNSGS